MQKPKYCTSKRYSKVKLTLTSFSWCFLSSLEYPGIVKPKFFSAQQRKNEGSIHTSIYNPHTHQKTQSTNILTTKGIGKIRITIY